MALKTLEGKMATLPPGSRQEAEEAMTTLGTALMQDQIALKAAARLVHDDATSGHDSDAGQEARNLRRVFALWRRVGQDSLSADDLGISRQQLKHLRDAHRLVAVQLPMRRGFRYPAWQFDEVGNPLAGIPQVIAAADEASLTPLALHLLMVSAASEAESAPKDALAAGEIEYVVDLVAASNDQGS